MISTLTKAKTYLNPTFCFGQKQASKKKFNMSFSDKHESFNEQVSSVKNFIPTLTPDLHKGQCGRIGVIGGSEEYTGAPYFTAMSALRTGADLVFVYCCRSAAQPIKAYSPELIVLPYLDDLNPLNKISGSLSKLHSLVIGPGLGRNSDVFKAVESIIHFCNTELHLPIPLIIDADGLYMITQNLNIIKAYKGPVILTPNAIEYSRLCEKLGLQYTDYDKVAELLNIVLLKKGKVDIIYNGLHSDLMKLPKENTIIACEAPGSVRRCGGQGDVLSGCTAVFVSWFITKQYKSPDTFDVKYNFKDVPQITVLNLQERKSLFKDRLHGLSLACFAASCITRHSSYLAYQALGRSMTASHVMDYIHAAFEHFFGQ